MATLRLNTETTEMQKADGFLNLEVKAYNSKGEEIWLKLNKGKSLHLTDNKDKSLIQKAKEDPEFKFEIRGTIQLLSEDYDNSYTF